MGDGKTEKRISDIVLGDTAWNPVTKRAVAIQSVTVGSELPPMLEIGYGDTTVFVTQGHPMVVGADLSAFRQAALGGIETKMNGYQVKKAVDLTKSDSILGLDGKLHKVSTLKLRPIQKNQTVWNITLDTESTRLEDRMIVANGIVTGDVGIQVKLVRAKK